MKEKKYKLAGTGLCVLSEKKLLSIVFKYEKLSIFIIFINTGIIKKNKLNKIDSFSLKKLEKIL